jgi:hypothetical protein
MSLLERLYELVTRRPYYTGRSMVAEHGPTLATRYPELGEISDAELIARRTADVTAELEARRAERAALVALMPTDLRRSPAGVGTDRGGTP